MELIQRQAETNITSPTGDDQSSDSFESWLVTYWYVLLIVLAVLIVVSVLICACVLKKHPRSHAFQLHSHLPKSTNSHSPDHGGSSGQSQQSSSIPTMPSMSGDSTPIPSHHSSQPSVGYNGRGNKRTSPRLSSTSSDTIRPDVHSVSSSSSVSLMGHSPTRQHERYSPMERRGSLPRRARTSSMVRVTSMPDVKESGCGLLSSPSAVSMESEASGRSGISYKFQPVNDSNTFVEVGVTVHTPGDPDKAVRIATAAAIAESARKLAQEAASFMDTNDEVEGPFGSSRSTRPYSSGRSSSFSLYQPNSYVSPRPHPLTMTTENIANQSLTTSRVGGVSRGHPVPTYPTHFSSRSMASDTSYEYDDEQFNNVSGRHYFVTPSAGTPRGRPLRSSLNNYHRDNKYARTNRNRALSLNVSPKDATLSSYPRNRLSSIQSDDEDIRMYSSRQHTNNSHNIQRKIPFHLTAAGRRQSAPGYSPRGVVNFDHRGVVEILKRPDADGGVDAITVPVEFVEHQLPPKNHQSHKTKLQLATSSSRKGSHVTNTGSWHVENNPRPDGSEDVDTTRYIVSGSDNVPRLSTVSNRVKQNADLESNDTSKSTINGSDDITRPSADTDSEDIPSSIHHPSFINENNPVIDHTQLRPQLSKCSNSTQSSNDSEDDPHYTNRPTRANTLPRTSDDNVLQYSEHHSISDQTSYMSNTLPLHS